MLSYNIGTPGAQPYGGCYTDFNIVESNMALRWVELVPQDIVHAFYCRAYCCIPVSVSSQGADPRGLIELADLHIL